MNNKEKLIQKLMCHRLAFRESGKYLVSPELFDDFVIVAKMGNDPIQITKANIRGVAVPDGIFKDLDMPLDSLANAYQGLIDALYEARNRSFGFIQNNFHYPLENGRPKYCATQKIEVTPIFEK